MDVKYEKGTLVLNLSELILSVTLETRLEMIESLSCDDELIKHVTTQIIEKWTENGYFGGTYCTAQAEPQNWGGIDMAWRDVAKASGDIAKREIERLESALKGANEDNQRLRDENCALRRGLYSHA